MSEACEHRKSRVRAHPPEVQGAGPYALRETQGSVYPRGYQVCEEAVCLAPDYFSLSSFIMNQDHSALQGWGARKGDKGIQLS